MVNKVYKIFIIEDDMTICSVISKSLDKWGFDVQSANEYMNIAKEVTEYNPHLVLLDINLPYYDGFYWCQQIRKVSNIPIIFISSRTDETDKIRGMTQGGDDYIEKPFSIDMLIAKIQAMLRRSYSYKDINYSTVSYKNIIIDIEKSVIFCNDNKVELTHNECQIMSLLMRASGQIVTRSKIIKTLWDSESFIDENTLTVNINRLRKKLKTIYVKDLIITIKGKGYKLYED